VQLAGTLNNCVVYHHTTRSGAEANHDDSRTLNYCCTTPLPLTGSGNITDAPLFVDANKSSDLRRQPSPAYIKTCVTTTTERDGSPRILGGTADMGAYEFATLSSSSNT